MVVGTLRPRLRSSYSIGGSVLHPPSRMLEQSEMGLLRQCAEEVAQAAQEVLASKKYTAELETLPKTMDNSYLDLFHQAFKKDERAPYPYQEKLAKASSWPELLNIPTGMGKTAAVTLAWVYKRGWRAGGQHAEIDTDTPRRLIWCLPMRVLVEQTYKNIHSWLENLDILSDAGNGKVSVHFLMGGEPDQKTWAEHPEEDIILIGTQDLLLSRALMRGYGMSRYQWPVHFAQLHNDCLWAFDEVQLMGAGLTTSAQLEAFRRNFSLAQSSRSIWLSATLKRDWLETVDLAEQLDKFSTLELSDADRQQVGKRLNANKILSRTDVTLTQKANKKDGAKDYIEKLSQAVLELHDTGSQTLVILNRVERAQRLFQLIRQERQSKPDLLIHARFRPNERKKQNEQISVSRTNRIIVATQAIEAGVDISSKILITELAPWSSLVQRFGRCNRYGEHNSNDGAKVVWIDIEDDADTLPYETDSLQRARDKLRCLTDVGPAALPQMDESRPLTAVLRRKDLLDLFNTDPDLSGFDVDVSDYIRDGGNPGLHVFWRYFENEPNGKNNTKEKAQTLAQRDELCPISLGQSKNLTKRRNQAWFWDSLAGEWQKLDSSPRAGMTLLLSTLDGGYDPELGFFTDSKEPVEPVSIREQSQQNQHEIYGDDWRSRTHIPVFLPEHLSHVADEAKSLCSSLGELVHVNPIVRAARWHDIGKTHEVFDQTMHRCPEAPEGLLAKTNCGGKIQHSRRYFRHELASALAWLAHHDDPKTQNVEVDLIAYLIAAHHGKVRMSIRAMPDEKPAPNNARFARGIWEDDQLPALDFDGERISDTELKLALMEIGEGEQGRSWTARTLALLEEHGPFRLAWLETMVRLADWRASAKEQNKQYPEMANND